MERLQFNVVITMLSTQLGSRCHPFTYIWCSCLISKSKLEIFAKLFSSFDKSHFKLRINFMFWLTKQLKLGKTLKARKLEKQEERHKKFIFFWPLPILNLNWKYLQNYSVHLIKATLNFQSISCFCWQSNWSWAKLWKQ